MREQEEERRNAKQQLDAEALKVKLDQDKQARRLEELAQMLEDEKKKRILSQADITDYVIANGLMLFFVGNDTSSGALALALHYLANSVRELLNLLKLLKLKPKSVKAISDK